MNNDIKADYQTQGPNTLSLGVCQILALSRAIKVRESACITDWTTADEREAAYTRSHALPSLAYASYMSLSLQDAERLY